MRVVFALFVLLGGFHTAATAQPAQLSAEAARGYTAPDTLVEVEPGRKLNLHCMGEGRQTVLFDSGGSDWSVIWALVQPAVAKNARACAYDRAGLGYSDAGPEPRSPIAVVEDMHALIHSAKLTTPLILVGHSLGGFNVKLYAALYPEEVTGIVLVDPSEDRAWERTRSVMRKRFGETLTARAELLDNWFFGRIMLKYEKCAAEARAAGLDAASDMYRRCSDPVRAPLGPAIAAERARLQVSSKYQTAQASEIVNSIYGDLRTDDVYARLFRPGAFGRKPVIVLTHGNYDPADPLDALSQAQILALHAETARLSRNGSRRTVPNTHHNIEIDDPQAIVTAVDEVVGKLGG